MSSYSVPHIFVYLVWFSSLLTSLQLLHVPATDTHIPTILIHARGESLDVGHAGLVLSSSIPTSCGLVLAVVETVVHGLGIGVRGTLFGLLLCGGAATEEAADGVADGGAYCDAAIGFEVSDFAIGCGKDCRGEDVARKASIFLLGAAAVKGDTYAAVLAI